MACFGCCLTWSLIKLKMKFQAFSFCFFIQIFNFKSSVITCRPLPWWADWLNMRKCDYCRQAKNSLELETIHYYENWSQWKLHSCTKINVHSHTVGGQVSLLSMVLSIIYSTDEYCERLFILREFRVMVLIHFCKNYHFQVFCYLWE